MEIPTNLMILDLMMKIERTDQQKEVQQEEQAIKIQNNNKAVAMDGINGV